MSIRKKLTVGFGAVIALMALSSTITLLQIQRMRQVQERITKVRIPSSMAAERLARSIADVGFALRNFALYGDDPALAAKYEKARQDGWKRVFGELDTLKSLGATEDREILVRLESDIRNGSYRIQEETMPYFGKGSPELLKAGLEKLKGGAALAGKVQADCAELTKSVQQSLASDNDELKSSQATTSTTALLSALLVTLTCALIAWYVGGQITSNMVQIVGRMAEIAKGDLRGKHLVAKTSDEIGSTIRSINEMQDNLLQMIQSVADGAEQMSSTSEQISSSASQLAENSNVQKERTVQVSTAIHQMTATVQQVSENANQAATSASSAGELAHHGGKTVDETITAINELAEITRDMGSKIEGLGKSSASIGRIIAVIEDIADQTNLLALNAAIEAARAGQQGRGFAVVADEVRKLAERTTKATAEISSMIVTIQRDAEGAVDTVLAGSSRVEKSVGRAKEAGDALQKIIAASEHVSGMITQIATAATQESAAADEIRSSIEQIAGLIEQSTSEARESAKACGGLSNLAVELQGLVTKFKVERQKGARPQPLQSYDSRASHMVH